MMVPLAEGAGLLWGGAAAGHQGSRQWQRWCRRGAEERQRLAAWVGGAVWVLLRGIQDGAEQDFCGLRTASSDTEKQKKIDISCA